MPTVCCQIISVFSGVACCICCFGARASRRYQPHPGPQWFEITQITPPVTNAMLEEERVQEPVKVPTDELSIV